MIRKFDCSVLNVGRTESNTLPKVIVYIFLSTYVISNKVSPPTQFLTRTTTSLLPLRSHCLLKRDMGRSVFYQCTLSICCVTTTADAPNCVAIHPAHPSCCAIATHRWCRPVSNHLKTTRCGSSWPGRVENGRTPKIFTSRTGTGGTILCRN